VKSLKFLTEMNYAILLILLLMFSFQGASEKAGIFSIFLGATGLIMWAIGQVIYQIKQDNEKKKEDPMRR